MHPAIAEKRDQIIDACKRYHVARLDIFGSARAWRRFVSGVQRPDFLVAFGPETKPDPYLDLKDAFGSILGRRVDLMDRRAIEASRNFIRKRSILEQAEAIYVA